MLRDNDRLAPLSLELQSVVWRFLAWFLPAQCSIVAGKELRGNGSMLFCGPTHVTDRVVRGPYCRPCDALACASSPLRWPVFTDAAQPGGDFSCRSQTKASLHLGDVQVQAELGYATRRVYPNLNLSLGFLFDLRRVEA
ncbi:unnamed protein product [Merluccius merluccius]